MAELTDEELCSRVALGDHGAFEALVDRHQARAYRLAHSLLGSEADARDVSQEAFIRLFQSAGQFDGRARFSTWFYRIVVNRCIDHRRREKSWSRLVPLRGSLDEPGESVDPPSSEEAPDAAAERLESANRLSLALARLSPNQRAAVLLQVQEGLTSREIAAVLNCSENTARVHIHRGLVVLRRQLKRGE